MTCSIYDFLFSFLITGNREPMRNGWAVYWFGSADECELTNSCRGESLAWVSVLQNDWHPFNSFTITRSKPVQAWVVKILSHWISINRIVHANHSPGCSHFLLELVLSDEIQTIIECRLAIYMHNRISFLYRHRAENCHQNWYHYIKELYIHTSERVCILFSYIFPAPALLRQPHFQN